MSIVLTYLGGSINILTLITIKYKKLIILIKKYEDERYIKLENTEGVIYLSTILKKAVKIVKVWQSLTILS